VTELDAATGAILARNPYKPSTPTGGVAHASEAARSATGDRASFLGRNGSLAQPPPSPRGALAASARASILRGPAPCVSLAPGDASPRVPAGQARDASEGVSSLRHGSAAAAEGALRACGGRGPDARCGAGDHPDDSFDS